MKTIYIYGAGGHGLVVADIALACGYDEIIFVDNRDNEHITFDAIVKKHDIFVAIGNNSIRKKVIAEVQNAGFNIVSLIHPSAVISNSVVIGTGTVVMPNVVVNARSFIGEGVILNSSVVVEHENNIGDYVHLSPLVALGGSVSVETLTHIGIGSSVIQGISIGKSVIVGAGAVVINDIEAKCVAYGNPCRIVKVLDE